MMVGIGSGFGMASERDGIALDATVTPLRLPCSPSVKMEEMASWMATSLVRLVS